ncbi:MAG TPA: acetylglutamate kinase [Dongiaceae bacterium]|jgi:acetylglutamate kinase|nr:acetylglutamate kinase [Dongiaceae bacterium]
MNAETSPALHRAEILADALPYMQKYAGRRVVIKYGGHAMGDPRLGALFARDIVLLRQTGIFPIVVHGGGPQIAAMLARLNIQSQFVDGLRVTDGPTMEVVEMVLSGTINKALVAVLNEAGGQTIGLSGKDGSLVRARKARATKDGKKVDLGLVGEPEKIDPTILFALEKAGIIPVIAPVASGADGTTYNINADTVAGAIAGAVDAQRLLLLTDVPGVLDKSGTLIPQLSAGEVRALAADGTISGGMIPKLETCLAVVEAGVEAAVILDGRIAHSLLLEMFTPEGFGTLVMRG